MLGALHNQGLLAEPLVVVAERAGPVASAQGVELVARHNFATAPPLDLLVVPGGVGVRREVGNEALLAWLRAQHTGGGPGGAPPLRHLLSVCTGAALLGAAGLVDGRRATTNKLSFAWATSNGPAAVWVKDARFVLDGNVLTSAGVSAGMDAALHLVHLVYGEAVAQQAARYTEFTGNWRDGSADPWGPLVDEPRQQKQEGQTAAAAAGTPP